MRPGIRPPVTIRKQPRCILRWRSIRSGNFSYASSFKPQKREGVIVHDCAKAIRRLEAFLLIQQSREEDRAKILDKFFEST